MLVNVKCPECGSKDWAMFRGSVSTARCDDCLETFRLIAAPQIGIRGIPQTIALFTAAEQFLDQVHDLVMDAYVTAPTPVLLEALEHIERYWDCLEPDRRSQKTIDSKSTLAQQQVDS